MSSQKQWLFGSFLIVADNRFSARAAYNMLEQVIDPSQHSGVLKLPFGKTARWMYLRPCDANSHANNSAYR